MRKAGWSARRPSDQATRDPGHPKIEKHRVLHAGDLAEGKASLSQLHSPLTAAASLTFPENRGPAGSPPRLGHFQAWKGRWDGTQLTHLLDGKVGSTVTLLHRVSFRLEGAPGPLPTIPAHCHTEAEVLQATRTPPPDYNSQNARDK